MRTISVDLNAGFDFDHYDVKKLPPLSEDEAAKWYASFYWQGRREVSETDRALFAPGKGPTMDPAKALIPGKNMDALLAPGDIDGDLGWCVLPQGIGYGSSCTVLENIPFEMFAWYKKLKVVDDLSYKIWYPGSHVSELGGISIEDVGLGVERIDTISPNDVHNLGLSQAPAEVDGDFVALIGGNGSVSLLDDPTARLARALSLFHYVRRLPGGGSVFRTHFYLGAFCENGQLVQQEIYDPDDLAEMTRRMLAHCIYERNNLAAFLPVLYERMKDVPL